ncbi:Uncharacterised protein [Bordetella pertussis]|nr:Uncharacterised protein [Bordetella pertussis]CPN69254.1 Uncharacterised protein [Bordetella pertussis]
MDSGAAASAAGISAGGAAGASGNGAAGAAAGVSSSVATTSMPSATLRLDTISASGPSASRTRRMTSRLLAATKRLSFIRHCLQ